MIAGIITRSRRRRAPYIANTMAVAGGPLAVACGDDGLFASSAGRRPAVCANVHLPVVNPIMLAQPPGNPTRRFAAPLQGDTRSSPAVNSQDVRHRSIGVQTLYLAPLGIDRVQAESAGPIDAWLAAPPART